MFKGTRWRVVVGMAAVLMLAGLSGVVLASEASAAATLSATPDTGLSNGTVVTLSGSGFADSSPGAYLECNNDPSQPTVEVAGVEQAPVGCTDPLNNVVTTTATGDVPSGTTFAVIEGTVGPPATGTDSSGGDATTDAANYPCPPTQAQQAAGDTCVMAFGTLSGSEVTAPITFTGQTTGSSTTTSSTASTTTTTTASSSTTSTTAATSTSSTVPCNAQPATVTGPPSMTVTPGTCLTGGTKVTVTGTGFDKNALGNILECNNATGQPTVALPAPVSQSVNVSCTGISTASGALITVGADGSMTATFTIVAGTTGPPCGTGYLITTCPADSTGGSAAADAANYPCPPTAAQQTAGASCTLSFGDSGNASQTVPISFVKDATPGGSTPAQQATAAAATSGSTPAASTTATTTAATAAGTLAFTGSGPDTWYTLVAALLLLNLGFLMLTLYYRPRELAGMMRRAVSKTFGGSG